MTFIIFLMVTVSRIEKLQQHISYCEDNKSFPTSKMTLSEKTSNINEKSIIKRAAVSQIQFPDSN